MSSQPSHETLFSRYVAGDAEALSELAAQISPELRRLAQKMGADREQSLDAVQETWLAVLRAEKGYDAQRPLLPWLHGILRFRWRSTLRRERRRAQLELLDAQTAPARDSEPANAEDAFELVQRALADLPERYRRPLELHLIEGLTPVEIAQRLRLPRSSVRVALHRGRALLRRTLPRFALAFVFALAARRTARAQSAWPVAAAAALLLAVASTFALLRGGRSASEPELVGAALAASAVVGSTTESSALQLDSAIAGERREVAESELELTVLDARGRGLAHVGVEVEPLDGSDPRLHRQFAVTDANGNARLPRRDGVPLRVVADRGAFAELDAAARRATLRVASGLRVLGRVVDLDGRALAGAGIWLGDVDGSRRGQVVAHSAEDGSFELREVPPKASLAALAAGHRRTAMTALPRASSDDAVALELVAHPGGAQLRAFVATLDGVPLRGARVSVGHSVDGLSPQLGQGLLPAFPPPFEMRTDESGCVCVAGLEPGAHPLVVRATGFAPWSATLEVGALSEHSVDVRMAPGALVEGRVRDEAGEPLAGAQIAWSNGEPLATAYVTADARGAFRFDAAPAGRAWVAARAFDHGVVEVELELHAGERRELDLTLATLPRCSGRLIDDEGAPLVDFEMRLLGRVASGLAPEADDTRTDANGAFELAVPGGDLRRIEVRGAGWPEWLVVRREWLHVDVPRLDIEIPRRVLPSAWLSGRLLDARGHPLEHRVVDLVRRANSSLSRAVARTDADGALRVGPLFAGSVELVLSRAPDDPHDALLGPLGAFELSAGGEVDLTRTLPAAAELRCDLRFEDGARPSAPIVALALRGAPFELDTWRTPDRELRLLPGDYDLKAMGDDFPWIDSSPLTLAPAQSASWAPSLPRAAPTRIALASLPEDVDRGAGLVLARESDGELVGRFELHSGEQRTQVLQCFLSPGNYRALVRRTAGGIVAAPFEVDARRANRLDLSFAR